MKYFTLFLGITMATLTISGCGKKNSELIKGRWKINDLTVPGPDMSKMTPEEAEYYKKAMTDQTEKMLATGYYDFKDGGICFYELDGQKFEGKWRMSEDEKKLYTKDKKSTQEEEFNITELTEGVLIIEKGEGKELVRITMKKEAE
ncbi:MAG TPA: lipocalin family protein [Flavobacteriales bacterium]|nr:lipocalin family protein [Flavobacteriales bacterium]